MGKQLSRFTGERAQSGRSQYWKYWPWFVLVGLLIFTLDQLSSFDGYVALSSSDTHGSIVGSRKVDGLFYTVFSTACIPFHDWQSEALVYSHFKYNVSGILVRIDSCDKPNYTYPHIWHPRYQIFQTPSFHQQTNKLGLDTYSGYNRPGGLVYWLEHDHAAKLAEYVVVLDPDMILRSQIDVTMMGQPTNWDFAGPGRVGGGVYEFGTGWYEKAKMEFKELGCPGRTCTLTEQELQMFLIGPPLVFTYSDLLQLATPWMEFTKAYRVYDNNQGWAQEMFGLTMALAFHGNKPNVSSFLFVSASHCEMEGWDCYDLKSPHGRNARFKFHPQKAHPNGPVLHYCQEYKLSSSLTFYKYSWTDNSAKRLMDCGKMVLPRPPALKNIMDNTTAFTNEIARNRREAFMIDAIAEDVNEAITHYRELYCK